WGKYRVLVDGEPGPVRRVLLTGQDRTETVRLAGRDAGADGAQTVARDGALFEYLIEPWGLTPGAVANAAPAATESVAELEYWFETGDDATAPGRVLLVEPPSIVGAVAEITP